MSIGGKLEVLRTLSAFRTESDADIGSGSDDRPPPWSAGVPRVDAVRFQVSPAGDGDCVTVTTERVGASTSTRFPNGFLSFVVNRIAYATALQVVSSPP